MSVCTCVCVFVCARGLGRYCTIEMGDGTFLIVKDRLGFIKDRTLLKMTKDCNFFHSSKARRHVTRSGIITRKSSSKLGGKMSHGMCNFLVTCTGLYNLLCRSVSPSVGASVGRSVGPSVGPSVPLYFFSVFELE